MNNERAVLTLLSVAALCGLLADAACNGALTGNNSGGSGGTSQPPANVQMRVDWGMSLLAAGTVAGMFPAKFTFDVTATPSCTDDYVAFATGLVGSSTVPSIIAFDELYSTQGSVGGLCNQDGPSVKWAYDTNATDTTGKVVTSPVLSLDGAKVAYVQTRTNANGGAVLKILKWKPASTATVEGTLTAPATPQTTLSSGQSWSADCPSANSCVRSIPFGNAQPDTRSSPFYDYSRDVIYVGDDNGSLHKFTGVFNGTPAEVTSSPWPIAVHASTVLSSPVFDAISGNIFIGDGSGRLSFVRETTSNQGTCNSGSNGGVVPCLGKNSIGVPNNLDTTGAGAVGLGAIVDGPIVDGTNGSVFAFDGTDSTANDGTVLQTNTALSSIRASLNVGGQAAGSYIHAGAFDNTYINSAQGATAGHLYVCAKEISGTNDRPAIFQLSFASNGVLSTTLGTPLVGLANGDGEACSPVTEIYNPNASGGAKEWIFFSIGGKANSINPIPSGSACRTNNAGCIISIDITSLGSSGWPPATVSKAVSVPKGAAAGPNGGLIDSTGGFIVDNVAGPGTAAQASSIYLSLTSNSSGTGPGLPSCNTTPGVGCAVKLTQSGLQ
jgi:hypothetical protein